MDRIKSKVFPLAIICTTLVWGVPSDFAERYPHAIADKELTPFPADIGPAHPLAPIGPGDQPEPTPPAPSPTPPPPPSPKKPPATYPTTPGTGDQPQPFTPAEGQPVQPELPQPVAPAKLPPFHVPKRIEKPEYARPPIIPEEELFTRTIGSPLPAYSGDEIGRPDVREPQEPETVYSINYNNVPIIPYIRFVSKISGTTFVFNEDDLKFNVTIVSEEPTTVDNIMSVLLQVLQTHGLAMAEQGNQVLIYKDDKANLGKLATVISAQETVSQTPPIITRVFHLQSASPAGVQEIIQPMLSKDAMVAISEKTNHLIVTDISGNIEKVAALLRSVDSPTPIQEIALYQVRAVDMSALINLASQILAPLGTKVTFVPQPATGTIFVIAPGYAMQQTLTILRTLDAAAPTQVTSERGQAVEAASLGGVTFKIYKLQYHRGDELVEALREIATSLETSGAANNELINTIATIQWLQSSNSLVISGTRTAIEKVKLLIQDLDIPLNQVYIELLVIQTTITNTLTIGVEWGSAMQYFNPNSGQGQAVQFGAGSTAGPGSPLNTRLDPNTAPTSWAPLAEGATLGIVGRFLSFNETLFTSVGAFINALQADQDTKILLNPKLLTQDNHTARIFVGGNFGFRQDTIVAPGSSTTTSNIQYRDVGTEVIITPIIGDGDVVTLEVSQSIGRVDGSTSNDKNEGITTPVTKSETETRVSVPDGCWLVISGQINDTQTDVQRGLPCLGGLPIIGAAFSTQSKDDTRDNLIIFIRPHIIRTEADMVKITESERAHFERASCQDEFQLNASQVGRLLNIDCFEEDDQNRHGLHDHYYDPCYEHDPCEPVCCD